MPMYIQTNVASQVAQNSVTKTQNQLSQIFARLSSGYRINSAADDAAGLGISKSLDAQVRSYSVAQRNANDAISMAQTADGAAEQSHSLLLRMRELAVQGSNGALASADSDALNTEFTALRDEIDRIANVTTFNGQNLLSAANPVAFQVGINNSANDRLTISFGGATASAIGVSGLTISTIANAQGALTTIDTAVNNLSQVRTRFGAAINRFQATVQNLGTAQANMSASLSRIRDADIASETATLSRAQVLAQAGSSVLSQANQGPQLALSLLRG